MSHNCRECGRYLRIAGISETTLHKWKKYELPDKLDEVIS